MKRFHKTINWCYVNLPSDMMCQKNWITLSPLFLTLLQPPGKVRIEISKKGSNLSATKSGIMKIFKPDNTANYSRVVF